MKPYLNLDGHSGVTDYAIGDGFIRIRFIDGDVYEITGDIDVQNMHRLAQNGRSLATYINRFVRGAHAHKL